MQIVFLLADALGAVSSAAIGLAWEKCCGHERPARKIDQLLRRGLLETPSKGPRAGRVIRLTPAGRLIALGGRDPEACWRRQWDGRWRMVLFDVPESKRALRMSLRRKLHTLGFGYLQDSVWVTPDSIDALRSALSGAAIDVETLLFMEAHPGGGASDAELVSGAWDFERINRHYDAYVDFLGQRAPRAGEGTAKWWEMEWQAWCRAVRSDPLLPEPLLPASYQGRHAWEKRKATLSAAAAH